MRKKLVLTTAHCEESLRQPILIGADSKVSKEFVFNAWKNEYQVIHAGTVIDSGQAVEELLEVYNGL